MKNFKMAAAKHSTKYGALLSWHPVQPLHLQVAEAGPGKE
jgi:hypothetical protein